MVASKHDNLCMAILRAKYKVRQDWLCKDLSKFASPIWKAIDSVKDIIVKGACYLIGDRASINVWQDPWIPWIQGFLPKPKSKVVSHTPLMVSQLLFFFGGLSANLLIRLLRAFSSALSNMSNAKYLAHLTHQTQKGTLIKCAKCAKIMKHATVRSHF